MTDPDAVYASQVPLDRAIMDLCRSWARARSKDPRTKVGAAVYAPRDGSIHLGYNGFPAGFADLRQRWDNRDASDPMAKYAFVRHAEGNAILKALKALGALDGCTLYVTHFPCHACMKDFISDSGIRRVVYEDAYPPDAVTPVIARELGIALEQLPASA